MILETLTALALGDSLTRHNGAHLTLDPPPPPWCELVGATCLGRGGATSYHWNPNLPGYYWMAQQLLPVDIVYYMIGGAEAKREDYQTPAEDFIFNVEETTYGLLDDGAGMVVLMVPPRTTRLDIPGIHERLEAYAAEILAFCDQYRVDRILCGADLRSVELDYVYPDLVHPTDHGPIADAVELWAVPEPGAALLGVVALVVVAVKRRVV